MYPKSAAEFVYTEEAFKIRLLSFLIGWIIIFRSYGCVRFCGLFSQFNRHISDFSCCDFCGFTYNYSKSY
jgi:hypothetical protein